MDLILSNGTIVTAHESYDADIGIEDGVIKQIGHGLGPAGRTVDCSGKILFPGGVDVHTHVEFELMGRRPPTTSTRPRWPPPAAGSRRSATTPSRNPASRCRTAWCAGTSAARSR